VQYYYYSVIGITLTSNPSKVVTVLLLLLLLIVCGCWPALVGGYFSRLNFRAPNDKYSLFSFYKVLYSSRSECRHDVAMDSHTTQVLETQSAYTRWRDPKSRLSNFDCITDY